MDRSPLNPHEPLTGRIVRLEAIDERHRDGLREAAERDPQIHRYTNMYTLGFDRWFDLALASETEIPFVVHVGGVPVGSTRYLNIEPFHRRAEIGWTWLERAQWGTGANVETKYLLLRNAFETAGLMRVEFKTDARNLRVRGALLGIGGAVRGDLPQAHGAAGLDPRLRVVRGARRRLAPGQADAGGEDRAARRMRCAVDVAPVRAEPDDGAEQVTQALLGEPLRVEERRDGWARVVTAYDYPGWMREEAVEEGDGSTAGGCRGDAGRGGARRTWGRSTSGAG